jgi:hypothetical protein
LKNCRNWKFLWALPVSIIFIEGSQDIDVYACGHTGNAWISEGQLRYFDHPIATISTMLIKRGWIFSLALTEKKKKIVTNEYQFEHSLKELRLK